MWEENPGLANVTAAGDTLCCITCGCGSNETGGNAATVGGAACIQQFMGHFSETFELAIIGLFSVSETIMPAMWQ